MKSKKEIKRNISALKRLNSMYGTLETRMVAIRVLEWVLDEGEKQYAQNPI
jgi:hypothetical protein